MSRSGVPETFSHSEIHVMEKLEGSFWSQTLTGRDCPSKFYHSAVKSAKRLFLFPLIFFKERTFLVKLG